MTLKLPKVATLDEKDKGFAGLCECGYNTIGWPTGDIARERILQHQDEHRSWIENQDDSSKWRYMEPLDDFRKRHGLVQSAEDGNLAVFPKGAKVVRSSKKSEE